MSEPLPTLEIDPAVPATACVIWLHGLGADASDFEAVVPELGLPPHLPVRFVFPDAPVRPVTRNAGYAMRAWYDVYAADTPRIEDEAGIRDSGQRLRTLLDREVARGIRAQRIVLAGFSQGAAMTLHVGLRYPEPLAGLLALSGYLPLADSVAEERSAANQGTPILLAHGTDDDVVRPSRGRDARGRLLALGYAVAWREYPMGHEVCWAEIRDVGAWLTGVLLGMDSA